MNNIWNNTCVLISNTGKAILSNPLLKGHNEAISNCAIQVELNVPTEQSMTNMLQVLTSNNNTVLLNCGKVTTEEGIDKRTGYLALPSCFSLEQLDQIENLKLLLEEEYQSLTVWKLENNVLKTKSMGDIKSAILIIQNMFDEVVEKNKENNQK